MEIISQKLSPNTHRTRTINMQVRANYILPRNEKVVGSIPTGGSIKTPAQNTCELGFFACFTTSGWGQIRAGSSILRACRVGRSAGRCWPGLLGR